MVPSSTAPLFMGRNERMPENKPIFVISDLHLGDGGPRDNSAVGSRRVEFGKFLDHVADKNGELVIVGDMFEFWQASLSQVIVTHLGLLDRLAAMDATYVVGNHDVDLAAFIGTDLLSHPFFQKMSGPFERKVNGRRVKFMHGHEVDPFNCGEAPGSGRILSIFAGIFEDRNGSPVYANGKTVEETLTWIGTTMLQWWNRFAKLRLFRMPRNGRRSSSPKKELTPAQNPSRAKEMLKKYREDKETEGYDVAIVGHTHQPGRLDDWYYNSGCWATKINSFVEISPAGEVGVFDWRENRPVPNETVF